jgi:hypothetical protein
VESMHDPAHFSKYLGDDKEKYYHDWLVFFQGEIEKKGWHKVINEYLLAGDDRANDLLARLYSGFLHPLIHLGFGVEFEQPAIVAEALAETAVHSVWIKPFLFGAEKAAKENGIPEKTLVKILEDAVADEKLRNSPHVDDSNKVRDGVLVRAPDEMMKYASQYVVKPEQLEKKTAEMINFNGTFSLCYNSTMLTITAYFTGAAQRPDKIPKIDFFFMHCINCSIFFPALMDAPWISTESKCRLLEWKGRMDVALYISRGSPVLRLNEIKDYKPKRPTDDWNELFERINVFPDDGHGSKLVRALANGQKICEKYEGSDGFMIHGLLWLKLANLVVDSVEDQEIHWVRSAGFDKAWEKIPDRKGANL